MKKLLIVLIVISFVGCNDNNKKKTSTPITTADTSLLPIIDTTIIEDGIAPIADNVMAKKSDKDDKQKKIKISCNPGQWKKFNNRKRPIEEAPGGKKGKPVKPGTEPPPPPPPTDPNPVYTNVIYINYFGKTVSNTMWNSSGTFTVQDAGLAQTEIDQVTREVQAHYPEYNVRITLDKAVYDAAAIGHKIEVVVTEDYQWYGQAGGVAYINSFFWTDGSPAFVFSLLLGYNAHYIAEAVSHEAGHTLGLRHQSDCVNGVNTVEYSYGKTMGNSYSVPIGLWVNGTNSFCQEQRDMDILQLALGLKQLSYIRGAGRYNF